MMKENILKYILTIVILIVARYADGKNIPADLSQWNGDGVQLIDKEWVFIPNEYLQFNQIPENAQTFDVGMAWNSFIIDGVQMSPVGKGTYMKTVYLPKRNTFYELDFGTVSSAFALYINDSLIKKVGNPYADESTPSESYNTEIIKYKAKTLKLRIVMHVQNWRYSKGGIWSQVFISQYDYAKEKRSKLMSLLFVLFGGLVIMSFYHGVLYFLRRKETSSLFFFLWTLSASFRLLFSGRYYPVYDLIDVSWYWTIKIEYLTFYLAIPLFMQFVYEIFPKSISKRFISIYNSIGFLFAASVFFTSIDIMTRMVMYYQVYTVFGILYLTVSIFRIVKQKEAGIYIFILGFIVLTISVFHDILVSNQILERNYWFPLGILTFVFLQAYLLASRFTATFSKAEVLSMQMNYMNLHLEKIVDERTEKLKKANELLQEKNDEVSKQSAQLEMMNRELKKLSIAASETDNGIIITDKKGEIEWVNRGFEKMYGFSLDELHKTYGYNLKNAGRSENMSSLFEEVFANKKSVNYESQVESKDGKLVQVQTTLTPILDEKGEILYMVAIDTDISQIKLIQHELSENISAKNKLFSIIAHDLRNPFNSLLGVTELIIEQYENLKPEVLLQFIKELNSASKSTYALLLNLLDWARSQRKKIELHPANYNLNELIKESLDSFAGMLDKKNINVDVNVPEHYSVYADKPTIETVFRNLISNAIKFSPIGSKIFIEANQQRSKVQIEVRDQGLGIPKEHIDSIFSLEGQYSTRGTEQEKGTGLGLILCKDFIERNKGSISVSSRVGEGSSFIIMLPAHK